MGLLQRLGNWLNTTGAKLYNGIRHGATTGYSNVRNVAHKIGEVASGIDNAINNVKSIPVIGQVATLLQNNPMYQEAQSLVKSGVGIVDEIGDVGSKILKPIDQAVTNTIFKDNPEIKPL